MRVYVNGSMSLIEREFDRSRHDSIQRHNESVLHDLERHRRRRLFKDALIVVGLAIGFYLFVVSASALV